VQKAVKDGNLKRKIELNFGKHRPSKHLEAYLLVVKGGLQRIARPPTCLPLA
jgi:hypothetical protein